MRPINFTILLFIVHVLDFGVVNCGVFAGVKILLRCKASISKCVFHDIFLIVNSLSLKSGLTFENEKKNLLISLFVRRLQCFATVGWAAFRASGL